MTRPGYRLSTYRNCRANRFSFLLMILVPPKWLQTSEFSFSKGKVRSYTNDAIEHRKRIPMHQISTARPSSEVLPAEVWLHVLGHISTPRDLHSMSFVDHLIRDIVLPLLFRSVTLDCEGYEHHAHPSAPADHSEVDPKAYERGGPRQVWTEKLMFVSRPSIASRVLRMRLFCTGGSLLGGNCIAIGEIVESLSLFPSLREIVLQSVLIKSEYTSELSRLGMRGVGVRLESSAISPAANTEMCIRNLSLSGFFPPTGNVSLATYDLIISNNIESLEISHSVFLRDRRWLEERVRALGTLPSLRTLIVESPQTITPSLAAACSKITKLVIRFDPMNSAVQLPEGTRVFPHVETFDGDIRYTLRYCVPKKIRHLTTVISHEDTFFRWFLRDFVETVGRTILHGLVSLDLTVSDAPTEGMIRQILSSCHRLEKLAFIMDTATLELPLSVEFVLESFGLVSLPQGLKILDISIHDPTFTWIGSEVIRPFESLLQTLTNTHPSMDRICLTGWSDYSWYEVRQGSYLIFDRKTHGDLGSGLWRNHFGAAPYAI